MGALSDDVCCCCGEEGTKNLNPSREKKAGR
jgi:hypothetical protein